MHILWLQYYFFFFQAEDGIRDLTVTGVQTCALPIFLAMKDSAVNQTYNLEGPRKVTVLEVAEGIRKAIGDHVKIEFVPARPGDFGGKEVSAGKAKREPGWDPTGSVREGLQTAIDLFRPKTRE